jgi:flagellar hook-basal body complex protein FliE
MGVISPTDRLNQLMAGSKALSPNSIEFGKNLQIPTETTPQDGARSFTDTMRDVVESVNMQQIESEDTASRFIAGQVEDVHEAMISMEKASVSFQFLVEVRNKLLESYREVMRMQV